MNKEDNITELYFKQIARYPLLSAQEEREIGKKIKDLRAQIEESENPQEKTALINELALNKNIMITSNLRLVITIAKKYKNYGVPLLDLINEGNIGLMTAAEKFDYTRECRFSTYGAYWIKQAIQKTIAKHARNAESIDSTDLAQDDSLRDISSVAAAKDTVSKLVSMLSEKERKIIQLRFGLAGYKPSTLDETRKLLNISRERVRQIQNSALVKLRKFYDYPLAG